MEIDQYYEFKSISRTNSQISYQLVLATDKGCQVVPPHNIFLELNYSMKDHRFCCRLCLSDKCTIEIPLNEKFGVAQIQGTNDIILVRTLLKNKKARVLIIKGVRQYAPILIQLFQSGYFRPFILKLRSSTHMQ